MKLKFLILISSLLLAPLTSGEVFNTQPLEGITSEVEEEIYVDVIAPIVDDVIIEDGGSFGNGALLQNYVDIRHIEILVKSSIGSFSNNFSLNQTPHYIKYCRLKIAC
ncbi:LCI fold-containing protein [uncultured Maribacter sp.]|uniref:LCI fold-containing protein n=1 Tax=uncultured Maribacter sp. TaxID=431308 RepID=UPI0026384DEE|nr:LCI fold-containing protein [uncultured Maribacter sp.]